MALSAAWECGTEEQTIHHVVLEYPIHRPSQGLFGLTVLDDETIEWHSTPAPISSVGILWFEELAQTMTMTTRDLNGPRNNDG